MPPVRARESHDCCMHLLQHELQTTHSSLLIRLVISVACSADNSNIISDSLITPAKNASVFFDHCWLCSSLPENPFGRPGPPTSLSLGVSFRTWAVARLLRAHTASARPDWSATWAFNVKTSCWSCVTESSNCQIRGFREQFQTNAPSCVSRRLDKQTYSSKLHSFLYLSIKRSAAKLSKPAVHYHNNKRQTTITKLCAPERHATKQATSTKRNATIMIKYDYLSCTRQWLNKKEQIQHLIRTERLKATV